MEVSPELLMPLARCLGWTLLHSLWQGTLIAGLLAVLLHHWRRRSPALRHVACLAAMLVLTACVAVTAGHLWPEFRTMPIHPVTLPTLSASADFRSVAERPMASRVSAPTIVSPGPKSAEVLPSSPVPWRERLELLMPWLSAAWLLGIVLLSIRHCGGWWMLHRLRRRGQTARPEWQLLSDRLSQRLGLRMPARLLESLETGTPMVAGLLKPVVLLPVRIMTGLSAEQLEAILAHELAHLARRDLWGHAAQVVIETCFFYHPAVWWMGHRARCEREHATDDLALAITADRRTYVEALARVAELQLAPQMALAATGGDLLHRIRRIVCPPPEILTVSGWSFGLPALVSLLAVGAFLGVQAADEKVITVAPGQSIQAAIDAAPEGAIIRGIPRTDRDCEAANPGGSRLGKIPHRHRGTTGRGNQDGLAKCDDGE